MARVYEGEAVGQPLVLKDVWLNKWAQTERKIQKALFKDIEEFWEKPTKLKEVKKMQKDHQRRVDGKEYKTYYLKIVLDHNGRTTTQHATDSLLKKGMQPYNHRLGHSSKRSARP